MWYISEQTEFCHCKCNVECKGFLWSLCLPLGPWRQDLKREWQPLTAFKMLISLWGSNSPQSLLASMWCRRVLLSLSGMVGLLQQGKWSAVCSEGNGGLIEDVNICHLEKTEMGNLFTDIATLLWRSLFCSGKEGYKQINKVMQKPIFAS